MLCIPRRMHKCLHLREISIVGELIKMMLLICQSTCLLIQSKSCLRNLTPSIDVSLSCRDFMNPGGLLDMTENMLGGLLGSSKPTQKPVPCQQAQAQARPTSPAPLPPPPPLLTSPPLVKRDAASEYQVISRPSIFTFLLPKFRQNLDLGAA